MSDRPDRSDMDVSLAEIERMLQAHEGPKVARPRPARARRVGKAAWVGGTAVAALVVVAVVLALAHVLGGSSRKASLSSPPLCSRSLRFHEVEYVGRAVSDPKQLSFTSALGTGVIPPCGQKQAARATIVRLASVEPAAAVGRAGVANVVYVAARACLDARSELDLLRCLREAPVP